MSAIRILSADVAAQIAAGEVIERPASVVKELVENSLDAGATDITVEATEGGLGLIRVVDNGRGIEEAELELAFQRHATSKLTAADDLQRIATLGFRGEALPSIAAVADVEMTSRTADQEGGSCLRLADGRPTVLGRRGAPVGSDVTVRRLFARQPARRRFLRSPAAEGQQIAQVVSQYALARPAARFTLHLEGRLALQTSGSGSGRDAAAAVYGPAVASGLLDIITEHQPPGNGAVRVGGLVSPPPLSWASRSHISLFVNGRWIQSRALTYAVEEAYQGVLVGGRHPLAILDVRLPPEEVDVNVHPTKAQVRFRREREVFAAVQRAVRQTLTTFSPVPSLRQRPEAEPGSVAPRLALALPRLWQGSRRPTAAAVTNPTPSHYKPALPILRVIGQVGHTYVVAEGPDGVYLIDQHAAHERVLYDQLCEVRASQQLEVQGLLEPLLLELAPLQQQALEQYLEELVDYGFELTAFGPAAYLVRAVPKVVASRDLRQTIGDLLDRLSSSEGSADRRDQVAMSLACHGAVRAGDALSHDEMQALVRQLEGTRWPRTCPHGRPTMIHVSTMLLEKEFQRR